MNLVDLQVISGKGGLSGKSISPVSKNLYLALKSLFAYSKSHKSFYVSCDVDEGLTKLLNNMKKHTCIIYETFPIGIREASFSLTCSPGGS